MIDFQKFKSLGWQFEKISYENCFNFKSPRMNQFRHYNPIDQQDEDECLAEYECESYLNQLMFNITKQLSAVESDIKRQLKIHVDRNLPIPPELGVDIKLKIV